jgi:hypothetical protein
MALQATGIADVLVSSLNNLGRLKFTDLMSDYQNTIALKRIMRKKKATIESGPEVQFNIITDTNHSARHVGIGYISKVNIPNIMTFGKMPWRHTTWNWATERRIIAMNQGDARIVDMALEQRMAAFGAAIILFEQTMWRVAPATDDVTPQGIPYFVVKSATDAATDTTNDGFNGTVPSGYTLVANIDPVNKVKRYTNYADAYTVISKDDLIRKMRRAQYKTNFKPLVDGMPTYDLGDDYGIYTNYKVVSRTEEILESQNENLGNDVASMDGRAVFMRTEITPVKELDLDTTDPVYMLDWGEIGAMGLKGEWMYEKHFPAEANQPTISMTNTDCSWNMLCRNRRKQAVLSNGTSMPA